MPDDERAQIEAELEVAYIDLAKDTTQTQVVEFGEQLATPEDCLEPPENVGSLAALTKVSYVRRSCIEAIALNTVGLGYTLGPRTSAANPAKPTEPSGDTGDRINEAEAALEAVARRDSRMDNPSLATLLRTVKTDEEETGQGYIEVSRDRRTGLIDGLYQAPSARVRRRVKRDGYVLLPPDGDPKRGVRFDNFGTKVLYDAERQPTNRLAPGAGWDRNELLPFKLYSSESRDYGLPRDVALVGDYLADKLATDANVSFFDSSGTPPTVLFVQGSESRDGGRITFKVPQETSQRIAATLRADAGHKHRVAIVPVPPGTTTNAVQLGEVADRDMGFNEFRASNAQRGLAAFRLQPIFVPVAGVEARYDAEVQRAITLEQVFDPEQDRYEARLTATVLNDLGFADLAITFKRMAVEGDATRREASERLAEVGAITYGELREAHGYRPLEEDGQHVPDGWNRDLVPVAKPGQPEGAENRVNAADDQRGLRPGIGGRVSRDKRTGQPRHVEAGVADLTARIGRTGGAAARRAAARASGR